ncbi:MAG: ABC transporter permease [Streptosporangiaceae bacterium]
MTANRAVPAPEPASVGVTAPEAAPGQAGPVRGSRGRHAGPAVAVQPGVAVARAVGPGRWRGALAVVRANPLATAGAAVVIAVAAFCFLGPLVYHSNQTRVVLALGNLSPRAGHPLGTDADGLDELGQVMAGGQVSLELGLAAGVLAAVLGSLWGAVAGYVGGVLDAIMMRVVDAAIAIPAVVVLLLLISIYTPSTGILVLVIAGTAWLSTARLVRAEALTLRSREYVQSVRVMGGSGLRVVLRHIAPNALGTIAVNVTFQIANAILLLATLSFLDLGVQFPSVDWGDMIANANAYSAAANGYWWQILAPGAAIITVVAGFTMLGDGLRDWFSADA